MSREEVKAAFAELRRLLNSMDVPDFRKGAVPWLSRNLAVRNKDHINYTRASEIITNLSRAGIQSEPM